MTEDARPGRTAEPGLSGWPLWRAGLRGKCPHCGRASVFNGFLDIVPACPACGLSFRGHDAGDGPAFFGTFLLGTVIVALAAFTEIWFSPPLWVHAVLWGPAVIGGSLAVLRPLKGLTIAIQHKYRSVEEPEKLGGQ